MAYIVVRNNVSGSVSLVEKRRVKNPDGSSSVRDVRIVCGLGVMSKEDFQNYQAWAHGMKDQEMRKGAVLGSHAATYHKTRAVERVEDSKRVVQTPKKAGVRKTTTRSAIKKHKKRTSEEVAAERAEFREAYRTKKGIKESKKAKVQSTTKVSFTGRKTVQAKHEIISQRIAQLQVHINNSKSDIRGWQKGRAGGTKIAEAKGKIASYEAAIVSLRKQRSTLRR